MKNTMFLFWNKLFQFINYQSLLTVGFRIEKLIAKQKFIIFHHLNHFARLKLVWWIMIWKQIFRHAPWVDVLRKTCEGINL